MAGLVYEGIALASRRPASIFSSANADKGRLSQANAGRGTNNVIRQSIYEELELILKYYVLILKNLPVFKK